MWFDPDELKHIRTLLAGCLGADDLELIVSDSGLASYRIEEGKSLELAWFRTLEYAARQGGGAVGRVLANAAERVPLLRTDKIFEALLARAKAGPQGSRSSVTPTSAPAAIPVSTPTAGPVFAPTAVPASAPTATGGEVTAASPPGVPRPRVFISHRTPDAEEAEKLATALEAKGIEVRLDTWDLGVGDSIVDWMSEALEGAAFVVLCYSRHGLDTPWIGVEWQSALTRQLNGKPIKILPVYLTGREGPAILETFLAADWKSDPSRAVDGLVRAIFRRRR